MLEVLKEQKRLSMIQYLHNDSKYVSLLWREGGGFQFDIHVFLCIMAKEPQPCRMHLLLAIYLMAFGLCVIKLLT